MAKLERNDHKALASLFTGNRRSKGDLKRSVSLLCTGTSIFYDNLVAEEAKERIRQKEVQKKSIERHQDKGEEQEKVILIKKDLQRFLWAYSEPVLNSGILDKLSNSGRLLQEAKFEIITSETTYLNSLNELIITFMENRELSNVCTMYQWQRLFGNITVVKAASELVLSDLLQLWHEDIMLSNIYIVLRQHALSILRVYKEYCRTHLQAQILLNELAQNKEWKSTLKKIEEEHSQNLTLQSYLALPMQRVTRLPLLLDAVVARLEEGTKEHKLCKSAISALRKLVKDCNESVGKDEENPILQLINKGVPSAILTSRPSSWSSTTSWEI